MTLPPPLSLPIPLQAHSQTTLPPTPTSLRFVSKPNTDIQLPPMTSFIPNNDSSIPQYPPTPQSTQHWNGYTQPNLPLTPIEPIHKFPSFPAYPSPRSRNTSFSKPQRRSSVASFASGNSITTQPRQRTWSVSVGPAADGTVRPVGYVADDGTVIQHGKFVFVAIADV